MRSYLRFDELSVLSAALSVIGDKKLRMHLARKVGDVLNNLESTSRPWHRPWFDMRKWIEEIRSGPERWRMKSH